MQELATQLAEKNARHAVAILDSIGEAVIATDAQGCITFLNPAAEALTCWERAEVEGKHVSEVMRLIHATTQQALECPFARVMREGYAADHAGETLLLCKEGGPVPIENKGSLIRHETGEIIGVALAFRQAGDHQSADSTRQKNEQQFQEMANSAPALLWLSDARGQCTFFNQVWLDFTGKSLAEELGQGWEAGVYPDDRAGCTQIFMDALQREEAFRMEYRLKRADGQYRWVLDTGKPRFAPDGELLGYVGSCVDISERKAMEQALVEKQKYIAGFNRRLQEAMSDTDHRVKNNLQVIAAMLEMRMQKNPHSMPISELKQVSAHIHILALVHELLTEQAKIDGQSSPVSARIVLERLLSMLRPMAVERALTFELEEAMLTAIQASSLALILNELVSNALKHGRSRVHIGLHVEASQIVLQVSDDGPGFSADFDPLRHANVGLDFVQSLTRLDLSGVSDYENLPEGGAKVTVTIPRPRHEASDGTQDMAGR